AFTCRVSMTLLIFGDAILSVLAFEWEPGNKVTLVEFKDKKGGLFGVPGAFIPNCFWTHLRRSVQQAGALKAWVIQVAAVRSVNDVLVTEEWGPAHNVEGKAWLSADPTGAFGKETDLLLDDSLRFCMVIEDGRVKSLNGELDGTGLTCSLVSSILCLL
uniref:thioredoxin-dependent peroxiredoxin n=1 Tax=Equus caballus TaxID=9796 RepID=A0A3Q2HXM2_HORSE